MTMGFRFFGLTLRAYFLKERFDVDFLIRLGFLMVLAPVFVVLVSVRTVTSSEAVRRSQDGTNKIAFRMALGRLLEAVEPP